MLDPSQPDYSCTPASSRRPSCGYAPAAANGEAVVSIVTPYYNTDPVFLETVTSVLRQSLQSWEWIIVDDGSRGAAAIEQLRSVASRDPRIRVVRQENAGPAAARNTGVEQARGRYICLLDSDDLIEPTFLEKCVWFLEAEPDFAFVNGWTVNFGERKFLWTAGFERGVAHLDANSAPPIAVVRRDAYAAAGGFDAGIRAGHEDWDFWLRMANAGFWGHTLPEYLGWYRYRKTGRFLHFMQDEAAHKRFAETLAAKYHGLRARFPAPKLKETLPYETPPYDLPFANPLQAAAAMRHVLFLVPWMVTGGADKVNLDLIAGLIRQGFRVTVCATLRTHQTWAHKFQELSPDVFVATNFLRVPEIPRFLAYLIQSRQIDTVVISGSTLGYLLLPYLRSRCPTAAFVDLTHVAEPHWLNCGHPRFSVGYQQLLDLNIVSTGSLRSWMVERGAEASRIAVCYTGVDPGAADRSRFDQAAIRTRLGLTDGLPVIVFSGRLCAQKRPLLVCDVLARARDLGADFQALIIGDGELRDAVHARLRELNLFNMVKLTGYVAHDAWIEALAVSDIFLLPSEYEGISVALYEAMSMKVVPVTTDAGGHPEIVLPDCGVLIGPGDQEIERYAQALAGLLQDPARRRDLAEAARERILGGFTEAHGYATFLKALDTARLNAKQYPRNAIAPGIGQELATFTIEYSRLSSAADFLWAHWLSTSARHELPPPALGAVMRLVTLLLDTRIARRLARSRLVRGIGRRLIGALERRRTAPGGRDTLSPQ